MSIEIFSVSKLNKLIKDILESNFYGIWVEGEVSSLKYSSTGHLYFSLIDELAEIGVIIYKNRLNSIRFDIENGMKVIVFGSIGLYLKGGSYRLVAEHIRLSGSGKKHYDLEKLKKEFQLKGYFDNKKSIPKMPKNIIIISSPTSAALKDIINILNRRGLDINIFIYPVTVQGDAAEKSILAALKNINTIKDNIDIVVLARGGGSNEDLWVFNSPTIAKALYDIKFPTISAIGHQVDFTLCDFVADKRAETPSAAAEIISQYYSELTTKILNLHNSIRKSYRLFLSLRSTMLQKLSNRQNQIRMQGIINSRMLHIDNIQNRMESCINKILSANKLKIHKLHNTINTGNPLNSLLKVKHNKILLKYKIDSLINNYLNDKKDLVEFYNEKLKTLNPKNILKRGYTITTTNLGKPVKFLKDIDINEIINTHLADGTVVSKVEKINKKKGV